MPVSLPTILTATLNSALSKRMMPLVTASALASLAGIVVLAILCGWLIDWFTGGWIPWDYMVSFLQGIAALILAWGIFPLIMPVIISTFVNRIARIIEQKEYPDVAQRGDMPFLPELKMDIGFALHALLLNLLALPLYLLPGLNLIVYYAINSHLLGKQYLLMVARRHEDKSELRSLGTGQRGVIYLYGFVCVLTSTLPLVNILAPLLCTALMVHVYHRLIVSTKS